MKKINIITLGCAKNDNDTDNLKSLLKKKGFEIEDDTSHADTVVVHTCSFIEAAKRESVKTILDTKSIMKKDAQLIATGCMVQQHGKEMMEELPEVSAFLGTGQLSQIPDVINNPRKRFLDRTNPGGLTDPDAPRAIWHKGPTANLRLSEGCSHPCSFCVIPKLRGGLQSRPEDKILLEARTLAEQGIQEFSIIGQDTGDWGRDLYGEKRLPRLLRKLRQIKNLRWIRLMYMHPYSMSDDLLEVFEESPEIFPYLDMPLQHIDNDMLQIMKRYLGEKEIYELLYKIRKRLPKLSLRTTFIVGYPGETDAQFKKLNDFVSEGYFNYMGSFTYSQEENTPAAVGMNQIDSEIKTDRQSALTETQFDVCAKKAEERMGINETIILEETEGDSVLGRTKMEAPEIDAIVRLPKAAVRKGQFVKAKITGYDAYEYTATPTT